MIEQEQQTNPALEPAEGGTAGSCPACPVGNPSNCVHCPFNRTSQTLSDTPSAESDAPSTLEFRFMMGGTDDESDDDAQALRASRLDRLDPAGDFSPPASDSDFDPLLLAAAPSSLREDLLSHLRGGSRSRKEALIAEYLVDCLDEHGYLRLDTGEAQIILGASAEEIEAGIARLQACEPAGIGARSLRECLLLQLEYKRQLRGSERHDPVAEQIVEDHWDLFTQRRYTRIARRLSISQERAEEAFEYIQSELSPYPAEQYRTPWTHRPDGISDAIKPDVIIVRTISGFRAEMAGMDGVNLQINPYYRNLYNAIRSRSRSERDRVRTDGKPVPRDLQKHVMEYVERADLLLKNIERRQWTIQRIAVALVEHQQGFLETGQKSFLRPLTRTQVAHELGMHESTISRALLHKYVQLPSQEVVSFDFFFGVSSTARDAVAEMVANEDRRSPLSDQAITQALNDRGISIARRTVVKYREELRLPASYLRRQR